MQKSTPLFEGPISPAFTQICVTFSLPIKQLVLDYNCTQRLGYVNVSIQNAPSNAQLSTPTASSKLTHEKSSYFLP